MITLRAHVHNGRLVLDEETDLPEGSEVELVLADAGDELDARERVLLHQAIEASWKSAAAGRLRPAGDFILYGVLD